MKKLQKIYLSLSVLAIIILVNACVKNDYELLETARLGFRVNLNADSYVEATYDISSEELTYDSVYAEVQFQIPLLTGDFTSLELHKVIRDLDGVIADDYVYGTFVKENLPVDTTFLTTDVDELFEGLTFLKDSLKPGYTIEFSIKMQLADGTTLDYLYGTYSIVPVLNGFCPLPSLPLGNWIAVNNGTQFTKAVTVSNPSPFATVDDGRFWLSDFGLDWSTWRDYWYTIEFKLDCPVGNDPRYVIKLMTDGVYNSGVDWTSIDHNGTEVTKVVRVMPYDYGDSKIVGHYDPETKKITFEDVPIIDTWWNADNHTVNLTFTYNGDN